MKLIVLAISDPLADIKKSDFIFEIYTRCKIISQTLEGNSLQSCLKF